MTTQNQSSTPNINFIKPDYLKKGDRVAIVAPAGTLQGRHKAIEKAESLLKEWGLVPILGQHLFVQNNHFAGKDSERLSDFQWALDSAEIKAIWCARGGYGTTRIIDDLNFDRFKKAPKWIIGYSDITAIHNKLYGLGYESIHGMMPVNAEEDYESITPSLESLKAILFGDLSKYTIAVNSNNRIGKANGVLTGGNLTLLSAQLGSTTQLNTKGTILFIEETGEYKYHIDRMLQSLKRAGYFEECSGVIVGDLSKIKANPMAWGSSVEQLIIDALKEYKFPIAFGIPAGHELDNRALIFGRKIALNVTPNKTEIAFE